ncbi:M42 family metallopeptidase [Roseibacillus ishigakijimensis]|uniref:M42 family metallopeptidase n=1 Tax=Roseibacillus ishigakijimensis TaxID=454146 RepID=A0A934RPZ6_9BACT|nr:M42 family metallopeptidase [Roseibacillus ishigakijimensis]MBK1833712.1 M42 family metallopeptidase [Roseibacillus ishigakijimensis]
MSDYSVNLLRQLTEAHSVPGYEDEVRTIFQQELAGQGQFGRDRLGSTYCQSEADQQGPRILVAGHMDEVGFRVQAVTQGGYLTFVPVGGWWGHNLLAQRVEVKTRSGRKITGVIASKPPHFLSKSERGKVQELDDMFIDIAASSAEEVASWGVRIGDPVAPVSSFQPTAHEHRYLAKAFDNRVGMAGAIEVGRECLGKGANLIVAGTVQEEVGLRGSRTLGNRLAPDVAIVLEGPPADDTPGQDLSLSQGILGEGVQIRLHDPSAIMNPRLVDRALALAEKNGIPHQVTVRRSGGTDAGGFHQTQSGVPCIVLGVPARYIHSHNGIIDLRDYQAMVSLTKALVDDLATGIDDLFA